MSAPTTAVTIRSVHLHDPLVRPLLDELAHEYASRYRNLLDEDDLRAEMEHYPAADFAAPHGDLVLLLADGEPVAGGAFRRRAEPEVGDPARRTRPGSGPHVRGATHSDDGVPLVATAELKRIWTHSAHRRRGLARQVLGELEHRAAERGYPRVYLTTGPRQPEAAGLYLSAGYTPLFDVTRDPEEIGPLAFEKWLCPHVSEPA
ncbi:GNAT family N-acetyltransferase [Oerskovia sp. KBS0722]|uniref:GNAT family N-acetyltransferase n=1 Tax=Oerskovia sp. KBS0722 TaxID=1179673 RepID=UPI00110ED4D2|nr:GNAT family N-acetyltransferase [Oerskovia sp. KBS0722]QDW62166.1 GNAT family N-acetyltransferase [Oerskovia sp. KBS0722]